MSSTNGSQNLFTNIFRPVYRYEIPVGGSTAMFTPAIDVCNIDVLSANSISGFTAAIGDENENVYVGSNAGNDYSNLRGCSNVTAVGYSAASLVSNVKNSVYLGYNSGAGAADSSVNVAIGPDTKGNGISNIYIGSNTGSLGTGFNNILIGHNLTGTNLSNTLLIGPTPTIYGNLSTRKVGIGIDPSYNMDVSGDSRISYRLGVGMAPGSAVGLSNVPHALDVSGFSYINGALGINADPADYTMNVNGRFNVDDGNGSLRLTSDGSGNSVIEAAPRGGKKLIFNIQGDLCATAIIIPGASYTGNVTASNLIASNDISGPLAHVTNIYGNTVYGTDVSGATARFGNLFAESFNPVAISVAVLTAGNGSVSTPSLTFSGDASAGLYLPSASNVAFTTAGVERMRISNAFVGIGTNVPRSALDVSTNIRAGTPGNTTNTARLEIGGGYTGSATAATNSYPTLAFQYGDAAGGYRHFVRTRHDATLTSANNGIDIFTNNSTTATGSTAPGTSNLLGLSITSAGVGVGMSNPTIALDVSGGIRSTTAATSAVGGVILSNNNISNTGTTRSSNFIGTAGTASNNIGGVTLSNTTLAAATVRNADINWTTDISGGIVDTSSAIVANFLRNARTPSLFDISGGNISNSGSIRTSNIVLTTQTGFIRDHNDGSVAFFDISGGNISNSGNTLSTTFNTISVTNSNNIGGVVLVSNRVSATNILASGYLRNALTPSAFDISGGNISNSGTSIATTFRNAASNWTIDISRGIVDTSSAIVANFLRNARTATLFDISGGNISNSATTRSSNFIGTATASNTIGGVTLNNGVISNGATTSNNIGGVILNNGVISNGATTSNNIGGVALNNGVISNAAATSNNIGGIVLSGNRVVFANGTAAAPSFGFTADTTTGLYLNAAGGLDVATGGVRAATFTGTALTLSNGLYFAGSSVAGFLRNSLTPSTYDISAGFFRGAVGAVNNPAYGFLSDTSAGLYRPGANQLGFTIAGIPRVVISNNNVGIGTTVPVTALDVCGDAQITNSSGLAAAWVGTRSNALMLYGESNNHAYIRNWSSGKGLFIGAGSSTDSTMFLGAARVGILTSAPLFALDVSASPGTNASINMNTWTRTTASVSYYAVFASIATNSITWTTCNAMDSNLLTVGTSNGTYFVIKKSGIYSINAYMNAGSSSYGIIDVSTAPGHNAFSATTMPQLAFAAPGGTVGQFNVSYTGFLPASDTNYYKIKANGTFSGTYNAARLYISFLGEAPTVTGVPY